jgi:hypothetical protein
MHTHEVVVTNLRWNNLMLVTLLTFFEIIKKWHLIQIKLYTNFIIFT